MIYNAPHQIAIPELEKALRFNPHSADLLIALVRFKAAAGDQRGAFDAYERIKKIVPPHIVAQAFMNALVVDQK
jgi:cytochrome c-type biogenesis protein CcmH/NrfG